MFQIDRIKRPLGLVLTLIGCFCIAAWGQQDTGQIPRQSELEDLLARSSSVLWGHVSRTESYWQSNERGRHIWTAVTLRPVVWSVKEQVEEPFVLEVIGGTVDDITEAVSNGPAFREGEEVILFLTGSPYRLIGGRRAKLDVYDGKVYWAGTELAAEVFLEMLELMAAGLSPQPVWQREAERQELSIQAGRPVIMAITPAKASAGTDTRVVITGYNFGISRPTVEFFYKEGQPRLAAALVSWSNSEIVCTVPVGKVNGYPASAASGPVTVTTSDGTSDGYMFRVTFGYGQIKWPGTNPTVRYYINENTTDCTGEASAVQRAASTWEAASGGRFNFDYAGSHTNTAANLDNGKNEVMWGDADGDPGVTHYKYNSATGILLECDLVLDDSYSWSTTTIISSNRMDVESVALHEFGHWLNLRDLYGNANDGEYDQDKVMYGYISRGTAKRALHADDIAGIRWIYPPYVDIGLRLYDGRSIVKIACEPAGTLSSPLRIAKNGTIYGIVLVDPSDPQASSIRIRTSSGTKALREY